MCWLFRHKKRKQRTKLILVTIINKSKIKILAMEFNVKEFVDTNLALVDHDTQAPIDATFANITLTSSDTSVFTCDSDVNADGITDVLGIAEGSATLTVTADATYTDSKTGLVVTGNKSVDVPVTITAPAPTAENTDLVVTFGPATPTA